MEDFQKMVKKFCEESSMNSPIECRVLDLVSEIGEVSKEMLKMTDYGKKPLEYRESMKSELGDVFYSLITIANFFEIDLKDALNLVIEKYNKRLKKGSAGSEND